MSKQLTPKEKKAWEEWMELCKRIQSGTDVNHSEPEKQKRKRVQRLLTPDVDCFEEFCQHYFPEYCTAPFGWFHREAIQDVIVNGNRNNIWEWSRELAKSVLTDLFIPSWLLFSEWLDGLILASENEQKASKLLQDIEANLRFNRRILHDFGDFGIMGSWLQGQFSTKNGIGFWAFGLGQNPAGVREGFRRPNLGIIDDADSRDKARNETWAPRIVDWIKGEFMGCLQTKNRMFIYTNNRVAKNGLTAHMVGDVEDGDPKDENYKHIKVFWTEDPDTHEMLLPEDGGVPSWDENYNINHSMDRIRDMGYSNAMRQLYHKEIKSGNRFTEEMLPWVDALSLDQYDSLVTYCDPAYGESKKGCYRCIVLVGMRGLDYDIIHCWLRKNGDFARAHYDIARRVENGTPGNTVRVGPVGFNTKVNCDHWVESGSLQRPHLKRIYKELNDTLDAPWYPRFDDDSKGDKHGRIETLEPLAQHGHIRFNAAQRGNRDMQQLREQFKDFPNGYIDGPDATHGGITKLAKKQKKKDFRPRSGKYRKNTSRMG